MMKVMMKQHHHHPQRRRCCSCCTNHTVLLLWVILVFLRAFSTTAFAPRPPLSVKQQHQQQRGRAVVVSAVVSSFSTHSPRPTHATAAGSPCTASISASSNKSRRSRRRRNRCSRTILRSSSSNNSSNDESNDELVVESVSTTTTTNTSRRSKTPIRFLGMGPNAIVREGAVLIAPSHEFHHFYRQSAIFIYSIGTDPATTTPRIAVDDNDNDNDDNDDSASTFFIRGLIIDHPTAFTINDVLVGGDHDDDGGHGGRRRRHDDRFVGTDFGNVNLVHRGGDKGGDGLILLHNVKSIAGACTTAGAATTGIVTNEEPDQVDEDVLDELMIGTSGLYQGGWDHVVPACEQGLATVANFKAFFNYCEFTERELDDLLRSNEDGDGWISIEVLDSQLLLSQEWRRGDCWRRLRNAVREYRHAHSGSNTSNVTM